MDHEAYPTHTRAVIEFLANVSASCRVKYAIRDNCGIACLDMLSSLSKQGIQAERVRGYFLADSVVYAKADFLPEMKAEFRATGGDFSDPEQRKAFLENHDSYKDEWKKIPHYWLVDTNGVIHDPSGYAQIIKTGLAKDLQVHRYLSN